ncbi:hypothetical protein SAMN05720766_1415 [Fibrobacter sp. UWH9]|uniref:hypothetical protein n=1 Tax=Fibrobacter sp. UWH9 TaxID=1896213 RepID=UPI0009172E63|nr:hypothetical protein [Fibrobacter sp. UWH9]SHH92658.1 hypothetical protein SAMN05720766_1415 [Fibrobacter sp. UWH9]
MKKIFVILVAVELFARDAGTSFGCCSGKCDLLNFWGSKKDYSLDSILLKNISNDLLWKYVEPSNAEKLGEGSDVVDMFFDSKMGDTVIVEMYSNIGVTHEKKVLLNEFECSEVYRGCGFSLYKSDEQVIRSSKKNSEIIYELYENGKKQAVIKVGQTFENETFTDKSNNFIIQKGNGIVENIFYDEKKIGWFDVISNYNKYPNFFRVYYLLDQKQSKKTAEFILDNINIEKDSLNSKKCFGENFL